MTQNEALRETLQHVLLKKQNLTRGERKSFDQKLYDEYSEVEVLLMAELAKRSTKTPKPDAEEQGQEPAPETPTKGTKNPYGKYSRKG